MFGLTFLLLDLSTGKFCEARFSTPFAKAPVCNWSYDTGPRQDDSIKAVVKKAARIPQHPDCVGAVPSISSIRQRFQ